jgi:hypothetical protein
MSAQPAQTKKGKASNLKPGKRPGARHRVATAALDIFCLQLKLNTSARAAAIAAGYSPTSAMTLIAHPRFEERMKAVEDKLLATLVEKSIDKYELDISAVDAEMMNILVNGKHHFVRGDADRVKAGETIYRRLKLIEPMTISATANAAAKAQGNTVFEVYKSQWQIDKEKRMTERIEAATTPAIQSYGSSPTTLAIPAKTTAE